MTKPFDPYSLKKPCKNCPFLADRSKAIDLVKGRLEGIVEDLLSGKATSFVCHKTSHAKKKDKKMCAGSVILLEKMGKQTSLMQVSERMGWYKPSDMKPAYDMVIEPEFLKREDHA